jgi:hypothetical protein
MNSHDAGIALADHMFLVRPDSEYLVILNIYFQTTGGFAGAAECIFGLYHLVYHPV